MPRSIWRLVGQRIAGRVLAAALAAAPVATTPSLVLAVACLEDVRRDRPSVSNRPVFEARDGTIWVGGANVFRYDGRSFARVDAEFQDDFVQFYETRDGTMLVSSSYGFHRIEGDKLVFIESETFIEGREEHTFTELDDGTVLVWGREGLFRLEGGRLAQVGPDVDNVAAVVPTEDGLFILAGRALYRIERDVLVPLRVGEALRHVQGIHKGEDGSLVVLDATDLNTEYPANRLFRFAAETLIPIGEYRTVGTVRRILEVPDGSMLISADRGLFLLEANRFVQLRTDRDIDEIERVHQTAAGRILVDARSGLYRLAGNALVFLGFAPDHDHGFDSIRSFYEAADGTLIAGDGGLFRLKGDEITEIAEGSFNAIHGAGNGELFVEDSRGLYRLRADGLTAIGGNPGRTLWLGKTGNGVSVIAEDGAYRLVDQRWSTAVATPETLTRDANLDVPVRYKWSVEHPCAFMLARTAIRFGGIPAEGIEELSAVSPLSVQSSRLLAATIRFTEAGSELRPLQLQMIDEEGETIDLGPPVMVRVDWTALDFARFYLPRVGLTVGAIHTAIFLLLIVASRWSAFCWRVLTDPVWGKAGLWFYFALRHFGPVQRWVMARWFQAVRRQTRLQPYLPMSLHDEKSARVARTTELLDRKLDWQRLWLQGNAGMGKTAIVLYLQAAFFADPRLSTLGKAFARYRAVPIVVPLREYRHVALNPSQPEDWVPSVARMAVSAYGVPFEDHGLFRAMIRSGGFLLVLDGANEVEHDEEIELFARSAPAARVLVTSQLPGSSFFTNWRLPRSITDDIRSLLVLFLGEETGDAVFQRIEPTPLKDAIRSGYDVRLIADVVEDRGSDVALPDGRLGLYRLILGAIRMPNDDDYPEERLCKAAWEMWRDGERKIAAGRQLDEDLLDPLILEDRKVLRILDGQHFEFRHDQMRAYLAARWAACHEAQPMRLFEESGAIWRLSRKEQEEVWDFFAEMYAEEHPDDAVVLWKWATADPDRVILQHALQGALKEAGRDPDMSQVVTRPLSRAKA
jgi:hypothetical protein